MTKEELEKYAHENRKRLDAQEVKIGDVVKVLRGQFAGETGVIVGIIVCGRDYADPYYEVDMDCEVPDECKCRKNTLAPNNVIGGLSAYEFEVIGNCTPMQSTEEIKVGDKVRVSKDAPKMYFFGCNYDNSVCKVILVDRDNAVITQVKNGSFAIPTKFLIKVDAEAKEPKFNVGDKVRKKKWDKDTTISYVEWHGTWQTYVYRFAEQEYGFNCHKEEDITLVSRRAKEPKFKTGDCVKISFEWNDLPIGEKLVIKRLETIDCRNAYMYSIEGYGGCVIESMLHPYTEPTAPIIKVGDRVCCYNVLHIKGSKKEDYMGYVASITDMGITIQLDKGGLVLVYHESDLELVQPKEQTEAEETNPDNLKKIAEEWANNVSNAIEEYGDAMCKIYVEAHNEAYWEAYTADLAHDLALKVANKYSDPTEAADYAVSVAKAVVESLKKK